MSRPATRSTGRRISRSSTRRAAATHFIDVWTRRAMLERLGPLPADADDRRRRLLDRLPARGSARVACPARELIGVDLVAAGLRKAHEHVPDGAPAAGRRLRAAARGRERRRRRQREPARARPRRRRRAVARCARILRPGARGGDRRPGRAGHLRLLRPLPRARAALRARRARAARRARRARGRSRTCHLGSLLYPAFWVGQAAQPAPLRTTSQGAELEARVARDIAGDAATPASGASPARWSERLLARGVRLPFGIRGLTVVRRRRRRRGRERPMQAARPRPAAKR